MFNFCLFFRSVTNKDDFLSHGSLFFGTLEDQAALCYFTWNTRLEGSSDSASCRGTHSFLSLWSAGQDLSQNFVSCYWCLLGMVQAFSTQGFGTFLLILSKCIHAQFICPALTEFSPSGTEKNNGKEVIFNKVFLPFIITWASPVCPVSFGAAAQLHCWPYPHHAQFGFSSVGPHWLRVLQVRFLQE